MYKNYNYHLHSALTYFKHLNIHIYFYGHDFVKVLR